MIISIAASVCVDCTPCVQSIGFGSTLENWDGDRRGRTAITYMLAQVLCNEDHVPFSIYNSLDCTLLVSFKPWAVVLYFCESVKFCGALTALFVIRRAAGAIVFGYAWQLRVLLNLSLCAARPAQPLCLLWLALDVIVRIHTAVVLRWPTYYIVYDFVLECLMV